MTELNKLRTYQVADITGGGSLSDAISRIGSNDQELILGPGTYVVDNDLTIPANVALVMKMGALLTINTVVTLTINGPFEAGLYQVFNCIGTGVVTFGSGSVTEVYPEWFGAIGDGVTDDRIFINAAIDSISTNGGRLYFSKNIYHSSNLISNSIIGTGISISIDANPGTTISSNPAVYNNIAFRLIYTDPGKVSVKNLTINCNNKTSCGIYISSYLTGAILNAVVENCYVYNCRAIDNPGVTTSPIGICIQSTDWGYIAEVKNCIVRGVTRDALNPSGGGSLACAGIQVSGFANMRVVNNFVSTISHNNKGLQDADGIKVFSHLDSGVYKKSSVTITNNSIVDCDGRFIKLQTKGSALITNNILRLETNMLLIANFRAIDSQVGDATIRNNKINITAPAWTGGASAAIVGLGFPSLATTLEPYEQYTQRVIENEIYIKTMFPYCFLPKAPLSTDTATLTVDISDNIIYADHSLTTNTATSAAVYRFLYVSSAPDVADFHSEWVWNIARNKVSCHDFIYLGWTKQDYANKWFLYVYDNTKYPTGLPFRQLFYDGTNSPYTSTCMIRDNHIGDDVSTSGSVNLDLDLSLLLEGSDFYAYDGMTFTNAPYEYRHSRVSKHGGVWIVQNKNVIHTRSADSTTWYSTTIPPSATTTQLQDKTHAINTNASKVAGYEVLNSTTGIKVYAVGNGDTDNWNYAGGSLAYTPS